jgi:hypothetical protein
MHAVFLTLVWIVCYWFCLPVYAIRRAADNQFATEYDRKCDRQTAGVLKIVAKENLVLETGHISSKLIGAEHFVLSTDLGRKPDPLPAEGYKLFGEKLRGEGISGREIDLMMNENPARLLGI